MLIGEYIHTADEKNRISLPSKFRSELGKSIVITHGLDGCLFIFSTKEWKKIADKLAALSIGQADSRGFNRFMLAGAAEADVDSLGRILIPDFQRSFAALTKKMVFAGVHNRVEVWNVEKWAEYKAKVIGQADALAQKLGEIGAV